MDYYGSCANSSGYYLVKYHGKTFSHSGRYEKVTENFAQLLKDGKLEEAKKAYSLIRMAYERSEPIAESFGESDIKIDYRLVDFKEEFKNEEGWKG